MERNIEEINVIPLVDVMLVLLVIVLTTATFITVGQIPINLSKAKYAEATQQAPIQLTITVNGGIYLEKRKIILADLSEVMAPFSRQSQIIIAADKELMLERFVNVIDAIKGLGFERISLKVEHT